MPDQAWFLRPLIPAALGVALAACAGPVALPLPVRPGLADSVAELRHGGISSAAPLTVWQVALLAVRNNPDLRAVRAQHGVAQAQVLQAGLLPNPQIGGSILPPYGATGQTEAWNAGFTEDIRSLIILSSTRRAAQASAAQVDAQILWQEWQVIGQVRLLAVDIIEGNRLLALLTRNRDLLAGRYDRSQRAVAAGNETLVVATPDLAALQTIMAQIHDTTRQQLARRHQLNALLGLAPDVELPLASTPDIGAWDRDAVGQALSTLATRRPDLVALQLGYRAQNAKLRTAILSQFPNLSFGVAASSDNFNVRNIGPQVSMELPIFNRNQGNIAIETATRQQLHDEYAARLAAADGQVRAMMTEIDLLSHQLATVRRGAAAVRRVAARAEAAFKAGNLDERSYVDLVSARLTKEQETVTIEQSLLDQQVAIATLIGAGMPSVALPATETGH